MKDDDKHVNQDAPPPLHIIRSQRPPAGKSVFVDVEGILHKYYYDIDLFQEYRFSERLRAEQGWFEKLVSHAPSVGSFYEDALRAIVRDLLPNHLEVATGFIFDADDRIASKQIAIIVYDPSKRAAEYKRGGFVVIGPDIGVSYSEVKKHLKLSDVREIIEKTFSANFGSNPADPPLCNRIAVFSYSSKVKTSLIFDVVFKTLQTQLTSFQWKTKEGKRLYVSPKHVVLPAFYFFDRRDFITSRLVPAESSGSFAIEVTQCLAPSNNSLNAYLWAMTQNTQRDSDNWRRDFLTLALHNYERQERTSDILRMRQIIPMIKLAELFPQDKNEIARFRIKEGIPFEVHVPCTIDLSTVRTFAELAHMKGLYWMCSKDGAEQLHRLD